MRTLQLAALAVICSGCAVLHRAQFGDVEHGRKDVKPISVMVSETTVNLREAQNLVQNFGRDSKQAGKLGEALGMYTFLFQFGPRTGTPVFSETYAIDIPQRLAKECPNGRLINVVSLRETRDYPVVKGEIVRVDADCVGGG